ncbi:dTDP-4-dehydrorhamnose 3,5-epimerase [Bradyrhizobium guangdongense]|uniref:dTDP-4-dehydrorhamnose 3,5-epimerase n=1 Tax=Bradyrhizobium guangdongense TaxID=1325090 RepID=UPI0011289ED6|nr:dTDP-4-dehydrorhamnose 3,5-epimerase [Bradyrhizobium guangdongense]TPQ30213.1 dTDP-4-dehydrorhamnose 3,5-epimerase [Bradyrhizobium guangdongense]
MNVFASDLPDVLIVEPRLVGDPRGFLLEIYHASRYAEHGIPASFVQDNLSRSTKGVLRGLHLQNPNPQGKLVSVVSGAVLDVAVDVRIGSPTFGRHAAIELSEQNRRQAWIPRGLAHGFLTLSERADVLYKCDRLYSAKDEIAIRWDDPALDIAWGIADPVLSPRDKAAPWLEAIPNLPRYGEV